MSKTADSLAGRNGDVAMLGILFLAGLLSTGWLPAAHAIGPQKFPGAIPPATTLPRGTTPPLTSPNVQTVAPPDLVLTAVSNPPAIVSPGVPFPVTDTTGNFSATPHRRRIGGISCRRTSRWATTCRWWGSARCP